MSVTNGDVVKAFVEFVLGDGSIVQNVFHFLVQSAGDVGNGDVVVAVDQYVEDIYNAVATYLADDFTINPGYIHKVGFDAGLGKWVTEALIGSFTPTITHTNTDDPFPNQIAPVLVANTLRPKSRGRKFLMGFVDTAADAGDLVGAAVTAMGTALNHYLADEALTGSDVLSPGVVREGVDAFLEFTNGAINSVVGTQRRRKPGVGS